MILSYHPFFHGHRFRLCAAREPDDRDRMLMSQALAVLLPPGRLPSLYYAAVNHCGMVFPNYASRYAYPGKLGDIRQFQELGLPHPRSNCFDSLASCSDNYWSRIEYPVIIKHSAGGEGRLVYAVHSPREARKVAASFEGMEQSGVQGFLVQELVPTKQRTLRVVVMHSRMYSYWRVQPDADKIVHNLAQGGSIDWEADPALQAQGRELVYTFCQKSGVDLAGIDILFDNRHAPQPRPLLLEVNYFFAVHGMGGLEAYHHKLKQAVGKWLMDHNLPLPSKDFG